MGHLSAIIYLTFACLLAVLLLAAYPLGLIPAGLRPDLAQVRYAIGAIGIALAIAALLLRSWPRAWRMLAAGAGLLVVAGALLLPGGLTGRADLVVLPAASLATLASLAVLAVSRPHLPRWFWTLFLLVVLSLAWQPLRTGTDLEPVLAMLALVLAPLAGASLLYVYPHAQRRLAVILAIMWLLLVIKGLDQLVRNYEVIGFVMNRNWMAGVMLALAPWATHQAQRAPWADRRSLQLAVPPLVWGLTLLLVYHCHSRSAWLGLILYLAAMAAWRLRQWRARWLLAVVMTMILAGAVWLAWPWLLDAHLRDVRIPLWLGTLDLISDHLFTGAGPGNYIKLQITYLTESAYHLRLVAAPVVEHPHNEALHIAASAGILAALAWLALMVATVLSIPKLVGETAPARLGIVVLLVQAMLDKSLVQPPADILAFCLFAIVWRHWIRQLDMPAPWCRSRLLCPAVAILLALLLAGGTFITCRDLRFGWYLRRGQQYDAAGHLQPALQAMQRATSIKPKDIDGWYARAVLERKMDRLQEALDSFNRIYALNPRYGHVNRMIANTLLMGGRPDLAITYYHRDAWLYPQNLDSIVPLYQLCVQEGIWQPVPELANRIRTIAADRGARALHRHQLLPEAWQTSVADGDVAKAIPMAERLLIRPQFRHGGADPLLYAILDQRLWPAELLFSDFSRTHASGWLAHHLQQQQLEPYQAIDHHHISAIVDRFSSRLTILDDAPTAVLPEQTWRDAAGNREALHAALAWFIGGIRDLDALLYCPPEQPDRWSSYVRLPGGTWLRCDPIAGSTTAVSALGLPTDLPEHGRLVAHPTDFLMRNLILYSIVGGAVPEPAWLAIRWPSERALRMQSWLAQVQMHVEPAMLFYQPPLVLLAGPAADEPPELP